MGIKRLFDQLRSEWRRARLRYLARELARRETTHATHASRPLSTTEYKRRALAAYRAAKREVDREVAIARRRQREATTIEERRAAERAEEAAHEKLPTTSIPTWLMIEDLTEDVLGPDYYTIG